MHLIVRNTRLSDRISDGPLDIGVSNGRIVAIERGLAAEGKVYDAGMASGRKTICVRPPASIG